MLRGLKCERRRAVSSWGVGVLTWRKEPQRPRSTARRAGRWRTGRRRRCTDQSRSSHSCTPSGIHIAPRLYCTRPCSRRNERSFSCPPPWHQPWCTDRTRSHNRFPFLCFRHSRYTRSIWSTKLKDQVQNTSVHSGKWNNRPNFCIKQ